MQKLIVSSVKERPENFRLLAQDPNTHDVCGYTDQDGFTEVNDIPAGFIQRVLPPQYGEYLDLKQVTNGLLMEETGMLELIRQNLDLDYRLTLIEIGDVDQ